MYDQLIRYLLQFGGIPPADRDTITGHVRSLAVTEGTVLLREGQHAREMFFIGKGILKIVSTNAKDHEVTQFFLKEDHFCTILNSFNGELPAHESIMAATDAELLVFSRDQIQALYQQLPYCKELIHKATHQTLLEKIRMRNELMGEEAATRYEKFLALQPDIALRVSLTDIASYLGITPQSLSRIRRQMR